MRLYADWAGAVPLDRAAARWEAGKLREFAAARPSPGPAPGDDPRIAGGFYFGRTGGTWEPYINPVSTAFALQALALWDRSAQPHRHLLI